MAARIARPGRPTDSLPPVEADERYADEVDGFVSRHRDELNASIRRSRDEVSRGVHSTRTIKDIIADGRKRHGAS
jgi:hypothetical protein